MLERAAIVDRPLGRRTPKARAVATNDLFNLPGVDRRTPRARRYCDIAMSIVSEIGGADRLSQSSRLLVRQAAAQTLAVEAMSARIVNGDDTVDLEQLSRMQNSLSRTLASLHGAEPMCAPHRPPRRRRAWPTG